MKTIYDAVCGLQNKDFDSETEARAKVEAHGSGYVVKFVRGSDGRDRSCAMNVYENGVWDGVNIHE